MENSLYIPSYNDKGNDYYNNQKKQLILPWFDDFWYNCKWKHVIRIGEIGTRWERKFQQDRETPNHCYQLINSSNYECTEYELID